MPRRSFVGRAWRLADSPALVGDGPAPAAEAAPGVIRDGFESTATGLGPGADRRDDHAPGPRPDRPGPRTRGRPRSTSGSRRDSGSGFFFSYPLPKVPVTDALEGEPVRPGQPRGGPGLRAGGPAGRHRPADEPAVVPARAGDDLRQRRPLAEAGGDRPAAVAGAAGAGLAGVDPAAGEPGGGVRRAARGEPVRRLGRDRGLPRRAERRPGAGGPGRRDAPARTRPGRRGGRAGGAANPEAEAAADRRG